MSYVFVCGHGHRSYSASKTQRDPSCPECGEPTTMLNERDVKELLRADTEIAPEMNIWYPGPDYKGREGDYAKTVGELPDNDTIDLVRQRAKEDGEWAIENHLVGDNADLMHKMMGWVCDPKNIAQCLEHLYKDEEAHIRTVDWVCRDLAQVTQSIARGEARG